MPQQKWSTTLVGTFSLLAAYSLLPTDSAWSAETAAVIPSEQADFADEQAAIARKSESPILNLLFDMSEAPASTFQVPEQSSTEIAGNDNLPVAFLPQTNEASLVQEENNQPLEVSALAIAEPANTSEGDTLSDSETADTDLTTTVEDLSQEEKTTSSEISSTIPGADRNENATAPDRPISTEFLEQQVPETEANHDAVSEPEQQLSLLDLLSSMENSAERKAGARRVLAGRPKLEPETELSRYLTNRPHHKTSQNPEVSEAQPGPSLSTDESATNPPQQQYVIQPGDTLSKLSQKFGISVEDLVQTNDIQNPDLILTENNLVIPVTDTENYTATIQEGSWQSRQIAVAAPLPEVGPRASRYVWPTRGTLTSGYGWRWGRMHRGVDIAAPVGTPVIASSMGTVEFAGWNQGGYGNLVDIRHPDGSLTRYAHNSELLVTQNQQVHQGQVIAKVGSTGYSTGPHLHFEIHQPNQGAVNPMGYLSAAHQ